MQLKACPPRFNVHSNHEPIQQVLVTVPSVTPIATTKRRSRRVRSTDFHQFSIFDPPPDTFVAPQFVYSDFDYCVMAVALSIKARNLAWMGRELEYLVTFQSIDMQHCRQFLHRVLVPEDKRWLVEKRPALIDFV